MSKIDTSPEALRALAKTLGCIKANARRVQEMLLAVAAENEAQAMSAGPALNQELRMKSEAAAQQIMEGRGEDRCPVCGGRAVACSLLGHRPEDQRHVLWHPDDLAAKGIKPVNGRDTRAHREMFFLAHPQGDRSLVVMHACDNPPCVNPAHLSLGTVGDNVRDMVRKGRAKGGAKPGNKNGAGNKGRMRTAQGRAIVASKLGDEVDL